jgi:hypothetical protein
MRAIPPSKYVNLCSVAFKPAEPCNMCYHIGAIAQVQTAKLGYRCYLVIDKIEITLNFKEAAVI